MAKRTHDNAFPAQQVTPPPSVKKRKIGPSKDEDENDFHVIPELEAVLVALHHMKNAKTNRFLDKWQEWEKDIYHGDYQGFVHDQNGWIHNLNNRANTYTKKLEDECEKTKQLLHQLKDIQAGLEEGVDDDSIKDVDEETADEETVDEEDIDEEAGEEAE